MKKILIITIFCGISLHAISLFSQDVTTTNATNIIENNTNFLDEFYAETPNPTNTENSSTESPIITIFRIFFITGILAFLTWIVLKYFFRKNALSLSTSGQSIEILATVPAGLGSYFLIAKLSNLYYLFSLSNDGIRLLDKISDQEAIDFIELNKAQTLPQDIKFVDLLEHLPEGKPKQALEFLRDKISDLRKK